MTDLINVMNVMNDKNVKEKKGDVMDIDQFMEAVAEKLRNIYEDAYTVETTEVTKNNDSIRHGVTIRKTGCCLAPNIYIDDSYEEYLKGKSIQEIVSGIVGVRGKCADESDFDADMFAEYEWVKKHLGIKLINKVYNCKLLKLVPSVDFADMALVFYVNVESEDIGKGSILIRNEHLKLWDVATAKLYSDALANVTQMELPLLSDIFDVLLELIKRKTIDVDEDEDETGMCAELMRMAENDEGRNKMFVLTNQSKCNGASVVAYPGMLHDLGETFGRDYYVLPSSIHEVILVPLTEETADGDVLSELVHEVNSTKLEVEEVLSDHAYRYHRETNLLEPLDQSFARNRIRQAAE